MALLSLAVAACSSRPEAPMPPPPAPTPVAAQPAAPQAPAELKRIELGYGVYELAYSPAKQSVYAATAQLTKGVTGGVIYQLDPATLAITGPDPHRPEELRPEPPMPAARRYSSPTPWTAPQPHRPCVPARWRNG